MALPRLVKHLMLGITLLLLIMLEETECEGKKRLLVTCIQLSLTMKTSKRSQRYYVSDHLHPQVCSFSLYQRTL